MYTYIYINYMHTYICVSTDTQTGEEHVSPCLGLGMVPALFSPLF